MWTCFPVELGIKNYVEKEVRGFFFDFCKQNYSNRLLFLIFFQWITKEIPNFAVDFLMLPKITRIITFVFTNFTTEWLFSSMNSFMFLCSLWLSKSFFTIFTSKRSLCYICTFSDTSENDSQKRFGEFNSHLALSESRAPPPLP